MRHLLPALLCLAGCSGGTPAFSGDSSLTVDHVFVLVPEGGVCAQDALREAGMELQPDVVRHDGQGTASVSVAFSNAYLELLWADGSVRLDPGQEASHDRYRRGAGWSPADPSPFGIAFRRTPSAPTTLPFDTRPHTADWMTPGTQIDVLAPPSVQDPSPRVFVVPRDMGFDSFRDIIRDEFPELLRHALGQRQLTGVRIIGPATAAVDFLAAIDELPGLSFQEGPEHLAELVFDGGRDGQRLDLRPRLPVVIFY